MNYSINIIIIAASELSEMSDIFAIHKNFVMKIMALTPQETNSK